MAKNEAEMTVVYSGHEKIESEAKPHSSVSNAPDARLVCLNPSEFADLPDNFAVILRGDSENVIGRDASCATCIVSRKLSRQHARMFPGVGKWGVEDLNSTNGVNVNDERVTSAWLKPGDEVGFGPIRFRFELEKPDISEAALSRPAKEEAQAKAEKTMIVGSDAASEAVLDAVRALEADTEVEPEKPTGREAVAPRREFRVALPAVSRATVIKWIIPFVILITSVGAGLYVYPQYQRSQEIEGVVTAGTRLINDIIDLARKKTSMEILGSNYERELTQLTEFSVKVERELENNQGNLSLANLLAQLWFLEFERELVTRVRDNDIASAKATVARFSKRFESLAAAVAKTASDAKMENLRVAMELLKHAGILLDFRAFSVEFSTVGVDAPSKPPPVRMNALRELKAEAMRYRRAYNRPLSVDYLVMKNLVDDVDSRDIALFNDWHMFLAKKR